MIDKQPTIWSLEPHTGAKHDILRKYLGAWFPKLAWKGRLVFIDGFAGPGQYSRGELGSPLVALDSAIGHKADLSSCDLVYIFIEQDRDRFKHLEALVAKQNMPTYVECHTLQGTFADHLARILNTLDEGGKELAPAFVMVDPFGFTGMPFDLIARVAGYEKTELLISFMYESIVRWRNHPSLESVFDGLFGCSGWREADKFTEPSDRKDFLLDLYISQLRSVAGMEYVRAFEMIDKGNRTEYFLIFATHSIEGLKAMKEAMWKIDPSGSFEFSDASVSSQLALFKPEPDFDLLKRLIVDKFSGRTVDVGEIEAFVVIETAFRETHYKRRILVPMEEAGEFEVVESPRKRPYAYPPGTVIRFP